MRSDNPKIARLRSCFAGIGLACTMVLAGCEGGAGGGLTTVAAPEAQYPTESAHFGSLQKAALSADYASFATHLGSTEPQPIVQTLTQRFGGRPFDVYTETATAAGSTHRRLVELRTTSGRLYLFVQLNKVAGGWNIAAHELTPRRAVAESRMGTTGTPSS